MKETMDSRTIESRNESLLLKQESFCEVDLVKDSDDDSGFAGGSGSVGQCEEAEEGHTSADDNNSSKPNDSEDDPDKISAEFRWKSSLEEFAEMYTDGLAIPKNFQDLPKEEQRNWFRESFQRAFPILPDTLIDMIVGSPYEGDCGRDPGEKPDWLDLEKFRRGQKFARDYFFGVSFAQLLSLYALFCFEEGLKPLIMTGKSSTPYTAFKRYLSTGIRIRNWFTEDPWTKGTPAYNDVQAVRKMHANVRRRLCETKNEDIDAAAKIENPYCPAREIVLRDFQSTCRAPAPGQCPYMAFKDPTIVPVRPKGINQGEMAATQFGFIGLMVLYPKSFGAHNATEEDLEAFCHTWRGLGYLLGLEDEFNFCRGSLEDVRERSRDFLELWVKPNLREITPEWEHMMRCIVDGLEFYFPGSTTFFYYTSRIPGLMSLMNKKINSAIDKAANFNSEKHEELRKKSEEILKNGTKRSQFNRIE